MLRIPCLMAVSLALLTACPPPVATAGEGEGEANPADEICDNGEDDDEDGRTDCDDTRDCRDDPSCAAGNEGEGEGETTENCSNGVDDDGDGDIDCSDVECLFDDPICAGPEDCNNGLDDDDNGLTDCDDEGCINSPDCVEPVPEDCDNGVDDDGDGNSDCDDGNCLLAPNCGPSAEDCDNGVDDDADGDTDCDDVSCADAGVCVVPGVGIAAIREANDGAINVQVDDAIVTVLKPLAGSDPVGFFVQQGTTGPAVFVAVDPDFVGITTGIYSFRALSRDTVSGLVHVTEISDVVAGVDLPTPPPQAIAGAADLVSNLDGYESEYIELQATVTGAPSNAGTGHQSVTVDTDVLMGQAGALRVRFPTEVGTAVRAADWLGCTITMVGAMWRFNDNAQPSFWTEDDVTIDSCAAISVTITTSTATTITLAFGRSLDADTVAAAGFTLNNGATVTDAAVDGRVVTLTTSALAGAYTVTIDSSVEDVFGNAAAGSASFTVGGGGGGDSLVINEIDYDQMGTDGAEFLELFNGGANAVDLSGFELVHINGASGNNIIFTMPLSGSIAPGGFATFGAVGGGAAFPAALQNGPDAVALVDAEGTVVDGIAYDTAAAIGIVDAELAVDIADPSGAEGGSLCRVPDGGDFQACAAATPNASNP
jgi:Lamin Tail Domain